MRSIPQQLTALAGQQVLPGRAVTNHGKERAMKRRRDVRLIAILFTMVMLLGVSAAEARNPRPPRPPRPPRRCHPGTVCRHGTGFCNDAGRCCDTCQDGLCIGSACPAPQRHSCGTIGANTYCALQGTKCCVGAREATGCAEGTKCAANLDAYCCPVDYQICGIWAGYPCVPPGSQCPE
jgi:hypothetical protein